MTRSFTRIFTASLCLFFACCQHAAHAQVHAEFSSPTVSGCAPLIVGFTDKSTGSPSSWKWDLGNGTISFLQNPTATYFNPGTYTVKLVVRNNQGADSLIRQQYITIYPKPTAVFSAGDTTGCFPHSVQFTDNSTTPSGTIDSRLWDFGDGTTSTASNPVHTYTSAGNFTVSLRVTNSHGCVNIMTRPAYITITAGVTAGFNNTFAATCATNPTIQFTNGSSGPGTLSYEWVFGDGGSSAVSDPQHTYTIPGSYSVSLIAISPQGCRDTIRKENLITYGSIQSKFTAVTNICEGSAFTLTNTTSPTPAGARWYFGDGTYSTALNPVKAYAVPGNYTIKLVNNFGACTDSISRNIVVDPKPSAIFSAPKTISCQAPFAVDFKGTATGANTYQWSFGDGTISALANPQHTYTSTGEYDVRLIVTNNNGCTDTVTRSKYIVIQLPVIAITGFPQTGCLPITVHPVATVTASETIAAYAWDFGDGSTGTSASPSHTYTLPGNYTVKLTITTASGCTQSVSIVNAVRAGLKPSADFHLDLTDVCASQPVGFHDNSTGTVDQWIWQFGDGGVSTAQHPSYTYTDTGYFNVTLIALSNTCADTIRHNNIVHVRPPIAAFDAPNNCTAKYSKQFTDRSIGANTWSWSFGDGNSSTAQHPAHTYASAGSYTVTLTVTNGNCSHTTSKSVLVIDEKASFTADQPVICKTGQVIFTTAQVNAANIQSWTWSFGDGSPASHNISTVSHVFANAGSYRVLLSITDRLGCVDTSSVSITVYGARANFVSVSPSVCLETGPVFFTDQSATDGIHPVVQWKWQYGDGSTDSSNAAPFQHTYLARGEYAVSLTITDAYGCTDKITKNNTVIIAKPIAAFYSPDTASCINKSISFINTSQAETPQYQWHFGDGISSANANPVHAYPHTGLYDIDLVVTDQYGCKDTAVKIGYINISLPVSSFTISDSFSTCPPLLVNFTNKALNSVSVRWDFGDGNTSDLADPVHNYTLAGVYHAKQVVTGPGGCTDTTEKTIRILGPSGTFDYTPLKGCNPSTVSFTATTKNRSSFLWDYTDGVTESSTDSIITHTYTIAGDYIPRMILTDAAGCNVPVQGKDTIHVIGVVTDFSADRLAICDAGAVQFTNRTVSNDYISSWNWDFGDGVQSRTEHPTHSYSQPGEYIVKLKAISDFGCSDTKILTDTVHIYARPLVSIQGDSAACIPANAQFSGVINRGNPALIHWQWDLSNGGSSTLQVPAAQVYAAAGDYIVTSIVTDEHNCHDTATKSFTIHPLPQVNAGDDRFVCLGTPIRLQASGASSYVWQAAASLSCTNCSNPSVNPSDNIVYVVKGTNEFGCSLTDSLSVRVRKPFAMQSSRGDTLCLGETYKLSASGADLYNWAPASTLSNSNKANPVASPVVSTTYRVIGRDSDNCFRDTADIFVKVYPIPTVEAGADQTLVVGSATAVHATGSADISSWNWTPAYNLGCPTCKDVMASPKRTTQYNLEVRNDGGCISKDALTIFVVCNNGNLFVPNTFSPNGNGMNEYFYPRGKGLSKIRAFRIFNRWGEMVFERQNFNANEASAGWDGTYKGKKLSADVFIYTCEVVCENNEILSYKGDVTLLR